MRHRVPNLGARVRTGSAVSTVALLLLLAGCERGGASPEALTRQAEARANGEAAPPTPPVDPQASRATLDGAVRRCREAAASKLAPDRVVRFDGGLEPEGAVAYMHPRADGLPIVEIAREMPNAAYGNAPVRLPLPQRVGVSGEVTFRPLIGEGQTSRRYFCELSVDAAVVRVKSVSIEIVR